MKKTICKHKRSISFMLGFCIMLSLTATTVPVYALENINSENVLTADSKVSDNEVCNDKKGR